ncbi:MAG: RuBisCO large subunit C-terminal-like domain-containing protein [Dialister sp.]|nr:RuBisCO large subunit C-terminal-like domain-containing protein [Dialister sp.]
MSDEADFFKSSLFVELTEDLKQSSRFTATYRIAASDYEEARQLAFGIAVEQTIECPYELIQGTFIADTLVGQIEDIKKSPDGAWYAMISYAPSAVGHEMTELLNMLFGNTSLQPGIRLMSFELPESMYEDYPGPRFGRSGIRELCHVQRGPILMSAIKPIGRSPKGLGTLAYKLALGGCPLIKDDHSLMNQTYAPFRERVLQCTDAVARANAETGGHSLYIANCTTDSIHFLERAYEAQDLGAGGIMAAPSLVGFTMIRDLARDPDFNLPIFLHPCFSGALVLSHDSGISPFCYYGQLSRLAGADAVIFTSFGGRFAFPQDACQKIAEATETKMAWLKPAFPIPSGGMRWQLFKRMYQSYGPDSIFLVGGALQTEGPDLTANTKLFLEKLSEAAHA